MCNLDGSYTQHSITSMSSVSNPSSQCSADMESIVTNFTFLQTSLCIVLLLLVVFYANRD